MSALYFRLGLGLSCADPCLSMQPLFAQICHHFRLAAQCTARRRLSSAKPQPLGNDPVQRAVSVPFSRSGRFSRLIAQLLIMLTAALIASRESVFHLLPRIAPLHVLERGFHLRRNLVELHASGSRVQGRFEAHAIKFLFLAEVSSRGARVVRLFRAAQPGPPLFACGVNRLGSVLLQPIANQRGLPLILCQRNDHTSAPAQRIFVNEDFVFRKSLIACVLNSSRRGAADGSSRCTQDSSP